MPSIVKLYGPPGTGKTMWLTARAMKAIEMYGPDRVAGLTFTRAAADELKLRIAAGLGLKPPLDQRARKRYLDGKLPWIGTIHSLALKMTGGKVLSGTDRSEFAKQHGGSTDGYPSVDDLEGYAWAEPGADPIEFALNVYAASRHRQIPLDAAYRLLEEDSLNRLRNPSPAKVEYLVKQYEGFKSEVGKIDFEDMLERGISEMLPVDVVLADEVQDNSPLLWSVLDTWSVGCETALAGDPYQAIYLFQGADPDLFINHVCTRRVNRGDSHRLTARAARKAQGILRISGFEDTEGWLDTWAGVGTGDATDGSEFYLARTARLLDPVRKDLEYRGKPYGYIRGGGPLETRAADAFRTLIHLRTKGMVPAYAVHKLAEACGANRLPHGTKAHLKRAADADPDAPMNIEDVKQILGTLDPLRLGLAKAEYLERVHARHGIVAILTPPKVRVGTIHSAKGKEADVVHIVDSWGTLPHRSTLRPKGRRAEGCVAYVAVTRHRVRTEEIYSQEGQPGPWKFSGG